MLSALRNSTSKSVPTEINSDENFKGQNKKQCEKKI